MDLLSARGDVGWLNIWLTADWLYCRFLGLLSCLLTPYGFSFLPLICFSCGTDVVISVTWLLLPVTWVVLPWFAIFEILFRGCYCPPLDAAESTTLKLFVFSTRLRVGTVWVERCYSCFLCSFILFFCVKIYSRFVLSRIASPVTFASCEGLNHPVESFHSFSNSFSSLLYWAVAIKKLFAI